MTHAELEHALAQQQAENAILRAALAQRPAPGPPPAWPSQEQLLLMQELYTAVMLTDAHCSVTWVNKGFTALCGLLPHQVLGLHPRTFLRPGLTNAQTLKYIEDGLQQQVPFQYEVRNPGFPDRWIRVRAQPLHNERGEVVMAGLLEDITDWKNAQSSLAESDVRFRALAENVPGVLYEWREKTDGAGHFRYVSPKLCELFGVPSHDVGRVLHYVHPEDLEPMLESIRRANRDGTPWFFEGRVVAPGQPLRWFRGSSVATARDAGGITYSGILQDITDLKQAQTALRESDLRWRLAVEGFGDGYWEHDLRTGAVFYSADYRAMLGYSEAEFPNDYRSWHSRVHPADLEDVLRNIATHLRGDSPLMSAELRMRCKDGSYKWVLSRGLVTMRAPDGKALMFTGMHTDISELKQAREALDASNRRLTTVIANFPEGVVLEDEQRRIVFTNEAFCRLLDVPLTPEQLVGREGAWLAEGLRGALQHPNRYVARITALLLRRKPAVGDVLALRDGRILQRDFAPIFDQDRYIGHLWKFEDITARSRAEADLKRREEKYRGIIENMSLGLVEADLDDHLLYANQSFCEMTGFCTDELEGRKLSPLLLSGESLELVESKLAVRQRGIADSYEIAVTTKSGELKWLLVSGAPLYDDDQRLVGSIGIYLDVTPQKQLEASLREAKAVAEISSRAKQDFLANMSHEIRTPMNAILGMSQLLAKTALSAPQASYLHAITASAENLLVIINDILDLSKIEAGRMAVEHIGFSVCRVCAQVEKTLQYKAEEKGLSFVTSCDPAMPEVLLGDPYRITQVLLNLAGNSVKFTERGAVHVSCALLETTAAGEAVVEFTVRDTGIGIDADYLAQVFNDFSQEDSSVSRRFGGTGLGLGISKKLVELLGGELRIESRKDHGTVSHFTLRLPVGNEHDVPRKPTADAAGPPQDLRGKRVLLVEDNAFNRMLAGIFLANAELDVTEASNGQVAVDLARQQCFDLMLMDVQMPVMNGYEATAIIRQELGLRTPIIALTANAIKGERSKCLAAGMNDYLTKPFQEAELVKMVYDWVAGPFAMSDEPTDSHPARDDA
ncbi:PAS domain S-box protein [Hymenobacter armeniacus]|uniref:histidine kinase n=1 Tax=Hymenobacter armeniacus TaxID=2771358 RepID=A0ABR8JPI7_9BACT|nr:PAS domain S-box protein [Hymenobacter armeniacus]MBD2721763.1 PAS domain S-box protein [Hymenobacter armeniacus]